MPELMTWLTPEQVAVELDFRKPTIYRMCRDGDLPGAKKFGREWRIPSTALEPQPAPLLAPRNRRSAAQQRRAS